MQHLLIRALLPVDQPAISENERRAAAKRKLKPDGLEAVQAELHFRSTNTPSSPFCVLSAQLFLAKALRDTLFNIGVLPLVS